MNQIIGIDLGTTFSLVACMTEAGVKLIPNALGDVLTPSVVGVEQDQRFLVGRAAKELQVREPDRCVSVFKRHMGTDWTVELGGQKMTPEKLSSLVLRSLKEDAEAFLGEPVNRAVITVPAYFNEHQRKATIRAGELAGLKVERILNEPTAAAIAYGWHADDEEKMIVVLDLGGGTFDVSVVELFEGTLEVRASSGETFLGGEDFTNATVARVVEQVGMMFEQTEMRHPKLIARLRQECEQAKRRLSGQNEVTVRVPNEQGELSESSRTVAVTREQFEKWTAHILNRIEMPIRRALGDAKIKRQDIDDLILVGGASRMPVVIQKATELFGRAPTCRLNPDEVVVIGAAVQAGLVARNESVKDLVVTDVAPFTLGIETVRELAGERQDGFFMPLINRNTTIPTSRVSRVGTVNPNQTSITVRIFQGEARKTADNLLLGEFVVNGIPLGPAGQDVDIRFTYDLNGVLEVEATIIATKKRVSHVITRHARNLSQAEIEKAIAEMAALKTHPREETVNRFLLRRAERLYQELPLAERRYLEMHISGFEEALELRDAEGIRLNREALEAFLDRFDTDHRNEETYDHD